MDERDDFERRITDALRDEIGPLPDFDTAAIARAAGTTRPNRRFWGHTVLRSGSTWTEGVMSMFSAARVVVAIAILTVTSGFLVSGLVGPLREEELLPAATEATVQPPTSFSGTLTCSTEWYAGGVTNTVLGRVDGGNLVVRETRGFEGRLNVDEMSDPRLDGRTTVYTATDEYVYPGVDIDDPLWLEVGVTRIETAEGAWQGISQGEASVPGTQEWSSTHASLVLTGEGAYEGLTAVWEAVPVEQPCHCWPGWSGVARCSWEVRGVIFEGQAPPLPSVGA